MYVDVVIPCFQSKKKHVYIEVIIQTARTLSFRLDFSYNRGLSNLRMKIDLRKSYFAIV